MAHCQNVRDAMLAIGWTKEAWEDAGHGYDPYGDSCRGVWTIDPYAKKRTPPVVVAASAPRPSGPREDAHAPPSGPLQPGTLPPRNGRYDGDEKNTVFVKSFESGK